MELSEYWENNWKNRYTEDGLIPSLFVQKIFNFLEFEDVKTVLDLGSGKGRDSLFLAANGYKVTSLDISPCALEHIKRINPKIDTVCCDISKYNFPKKKFDMVFANLSLHYWDDKTLKKIVKSVFNSLTDDGLFCMTCKSVNDRGYGRGVKVGKDMFQNGHAIRFFDIDFTRKLLKRFKVITIAETTVNEPHYGSYTMIEAIARQF